MRFWFDKIFADEIADMEDRSKVAAIAVLGLDDLEMVEGFIQQKNAALAGTPRGLVKLLRSWELTRDNLTKSRVRATTWYQFAREVGDPGTNSRLQAETDKWWAEVKALFKPKEPSSQPSPNPDL